MSFSARLKFSVILWQAWYLFEQASCHETVFRVTEAPNSDIKG